MPQACHGYSASLSMRLRWGWQETNTQLMCFKRLARQEERALPARLSAGKARVEAQQLRESELQDRFKELLGRKADLASGSREEATAD